MELRTIKTNRVLVIRRTLDNKWSTYSVACDTNFVVPAHASFSPLKNYWQWRDTGFGHPECPACTLGTCHQLLTAYASGTLIVAHEWAGN